MVVEPPGSAGAPPRAPATGVAMAIGKTLDLVRAHRDEYDAAEEPRILEIAPARYLALAGKGAPGGAEFQAAVAALMKVAQAMRMERRHGHDFKVGPLEARWWAPKRRGGPWSWEALVRVPEQLSEREVKEAGERIAARGHVEAKKVRLERLEEGRCVQAMHVGPWADEGTTIARMDEAAHAAGRALAGPHHEVYLSDPRRTAAARLKTLLRQPLGPAHHAAGPRGRDRLPSTLREVRTGATPQHRATSLPRSP